MLRLRPYKRCDASYLLKWVPTEPAFTMWSADQFQYPLTTEQLSVYRLRFEENENSWIFIALDEEGIPAGHFSMRSADYKNESVHMGFIIVDPTKRGRGYGSEMIRLALTYAFEVLRMKKVTLSVFEQNAAARHCYESAGFYVEEIRRDVFTYRDEKWTLYDMAATPESFHL